MHQARRNFIKKMTMGTACLALSGYAFGMLPKNRSGNGLDVFSTDNMPGQNQIFPFFNYLNQFNIGDFISKDQGGKFIQMELLHTEDDSKIVELIRDGLLEKIYGDPIVWDRFENTEVEKSVWLNRFYYLPSFARMYYLTNDITYLNDMMSLINRWIRENPLLPDSHSKTYNWRDMQVAWRSIHWSWCYFLTEKALTEDQKSIILNSLKQHAGILLSGFGKQPLNEFNHQSHGALAMLYLGVLFPAFETANDLRQTALKILEHHLDKAFYNDGGNVEQMFGYYPFETHIFRDTYLLCSHNKIELPPRLLPMLEKMAIFLSTVSQPDGTMPAINDSYEMPVIPMLTVLNEILENRPKNQSMSSRYFQETQIGVIHGDDRNNQWYVLANPAKSIGSHAHAGRLAFTLWHNKKPIVIDSGCCNYDNPKLVSWYRTSKAHNTVLIDGKSDEATSSDRLWVAKRLTENHIADWAEEIQYTLCRMVSPSTETVNSSVNWSRSLALLKNRYLVLHDCFESDEEHTYEMLFHFPPVEVSVDDQNKSIRIYKTDPIHLFPANPQNIDSLNRSEGLVSIKGESTPAPMATYKLRGKGVLHSIMIFVPYDEDSSTIKLKQKTNDQGTGLSIMHSQSDKTIVLFRNPEAKELKLFGCSTSKIFEVL